MPVLMPFQRCLDYINEYNRQKSLPGFPIKYVLVACCKSKRRERRQTINNQSNK